MDLIPRDLLEDICCHGLAQRVLAYHVPVGQRDFLSAEIQDGLPLQSLCQALDRGLALGVGFLAPFLNGFGRWQSKLA